MTAPVYFVTYFIISFKNALTTAELLTFSSIYGTITDAETGDPIPNAKITTHPYTDGSDDVICVPPAPHYTDSLGRYEITVNLGKRYISASVSHYEDTYYYDDIQSVIVDIVDATPVEMNFRFKKEYFQ